MSIWWSECLEQIAFNFLLEVEETLGNAVWKDFQSQITFYDNYEKT